MHRQGTCVYSVGCYNNMLLTTIGFSPGGSGHLKHTKHETGLVLNLRPEGYMRSM
jgi:hypothetical protein